MVPKTIHYCWFGGKPIPKEYQRYIDSWRRYMPDFEIKEWNEGNYDVNCIPFSKEAYSVGKYAYVSDYARLKILYENGGVYFDTDVEVIKPMDDILCQGGFMAVEKWKEQNPDALYVNPGLGFACEPHNPVIREIMEFYESHHYIYPDGHIEQIPIVPVATEVLKRHGLVKSDNPLTLNPYEPSEGLLKRDNSLTIYPWEYFCPMEYLCNKIEITENTHTIHHYSATWMSWKDKLTMKKGYYSAIIKRFLKFTKK